MRKRTFWKRVLWIAGGVLFAVGLGAVILAVLLNTRWGSNEIRSHVLPRMNASLAGDLDFDRLSFGGDRLVLTDLVLRDPEGRVVAEVDRVAVVFSPMALFSRRLELESVVIDRPRLYLVSDRRGLNLVRATRGSAPEEERGDPQAADRPETWAVQLSRLLVRDGHLQHRQVRPGADRVMVVDRVRAEGNARYAPTSRLGRARLELEGRSRAPVAGPVSLSVFASSDGSQATGTARASVQKSRAFVTARVRSVSGSPELRLHLHSLRVEPALIAAFLPGYPVRVPIEAHGTIRYDEPALLADLTAVAAGRGGRIDLQANVDLDSRQARRLTLDGQHIDLSGLLHRAPASDLDFSLVASGGGADLEDLSGALTLRFPRGSLGGQTLGPVHLEARARDGTLERLAMTAAAPGLGLELRGRGDADAFVATAELAVRNLSATARAFERQGAIAGRGRLVVKAKGPWSGPQVSARGRLRGLAIQGQRIGTADFQIAVPDARKPLIASGRLRLDRAQVGGQVVKGVRVSLRSGPDHRFSIAARAAAPQPLSVQAAGRWIDETGSLGQILALARLRLAYPEATWRLASPVRIRLQPWVLVPALELVSGQMELGFSFSERRGTRFRLQIRRLALARLPQLVRRALGRATGQLDASVALELPDGGRGGRLDLDLAARGLTLGGRQVGRVDLAASAHPGSPLQAELTVFREGTPATARLSVPLDLARFLRRPPTSAELLRLPFQAQLAVERFPIDAARALAPALDRLRVRGAVSLDVDLRGPLTAPSGHVRLVADGLATRRLPPTDVVLELQAPPSASAVELSAEVKRRGRPLLVLDSKIGVSARALGELVRRGNHQALARLPVALEGRVGPLRLQRIPVAAASARGRPRILRGTLAAELSVAGRLGDPTIRLDAHASGIALEGAALGEARLKLHYADERPRLDLRLRGSDGGTVHLAAETAADLGFPQVTRLSPSRWPIEATLAADRYDLGLLSCVSDAVPVVGGRLFARGRVTGELGTPEIHGRLEWKDGQVRLAELGEYRNIHLLLHGDRRRIVLQELLAEAGAGDARLTGQGILRPGGGYRVKADATLRRFPIYAQGQPLAAVGMDATVAGLVAPAGVDLVARVEEANVRLTAGGRRDLQSLDRPPDVVLTWNGEPLNRRQAKKQQAIEQRLAVLRGEADADDGPDQAKADGAKSRLVRLTIDAPNNLWVRGPDANLELGLGPDFRVTAEEELRIFGSVHVRRGQIEVLGRRFQIDDSSVLRFTGPPDRPVLDVRAVHEPRHAPDTLVVVSIDGPADALDITLESPGHPEYAQSDLILLVATGRAPEDGQTGTAAPSLGGSAVSLLGGFLASKVQSTLMRNLPIDVLNIDPGDQLTGLQLEAGTYLGDDLYVAYVGRVGQDPFLRENRNEIQLEYQLSSRWSFEASYGDARRGSADLVWTKRY